MRDGSALLVLDGAVSFVTGAYLALAPSVYFFALRQKERKNWTESLVVAAVFALLFASACLTIFGLNVYKLRLEEEARQFADRTFRNVFVDGDGEFLRSHATARLINEGGTIGLSSFMTGRLQFGIPRDLEHARGRIHFRVVFPHLIAEGIMFTNARSAQGPVQFHARIGSAGGEWEIDAISWRYALPDTAPN